MIQSIGPHNIGYYAYQKSNENFAFRLFLKEHADEKALDAQFAALHRELFDSYDCAGCRNCCKKYFEQPCRHLTDDQLCDLGDQMPEDCKLYPYTDQPRRLSSMLNTIDIASVCPVVYEMLERLKEMYEFSGKKAEKYLRLVNQQDAFMTKGDMDLARIRQEDPVRYLVMLLQESTVSPSVTDYQKYVRAYDELWTAVKDQITRTFPDRKPKTSEISSKEAGYTTYFNNILQDIDDALQNQKEYDKRAAFCRDVLDLFDLEDPGSYQHMNFACGVGESLSDAGHIQESDAYYEKIMEDFHYSGYVVANYILTLRSRGEDEKARRLLEQHIRPDMELSKDNEMLIERACEIYGDTGDDTKFRIYENLRRRMYHQPPLSQAENTGGIMTPLFQAVTAGKSAKVKKKKIYPNDPCPCGSGKKYKKCCGRK